MQTTFKIRRFTIAHKIIKQSLLHGALLHKKDKNFIAADTSRSFLAH